MAGLKTETSLLDTLRHGLLAIALPRLDELPPGERERAVEQARQIEFDATERIGLVAGVVLTAYLLRFDVAQAQAMSLPLRYLMQFVSALPLLALLVGPFLLRRTRRGLEQVIAAHRRDSHKEANHASDPQGH
jgi:hypothetical protein